MIGDAGTREGDWLVALTQESGRGRQGRAWVSASGNFFGSTIVDLAPGDPPAQSLSLAAGLALIEAVETAAPDLPLMLKWPNDLLLGEAKIGGVLLERSGNRVVAGFGVNLASAPAVEGRKVAHLGGAITAQAFAPLLAGSMARMAGLWRSATSDACARAWLARAHPLGTGLVVHASADETVSGTFAGLEPDGALRLLLSGGQVEVIRAGDVGLG